MLGPAPIVDFDGTLARLEVDWDRVRAVLGVTTVSALWATDGGQWPVVEQAEVAAAREAEPVLGVLDALASVRRFAVLTDNAEHAVRVFVDRFPALRSRLGVVVGRETLGGPKRDPARFGTGFARCREATASARGDSPMVYVGDQAYELELASSAGAKALHAESVIGPSEGPLR